MSDFDEFIYDIIDKMELSELPSYNSVDHCSDNIQQSEYCSNSSLWLINKGRHSVDKLSGKIRPKFKMGP